MKYTEKWRETCDPFSLQYHNFKPIEVLGYPHAGNDVFYMRGIYRNRKVNAFVKVARQTGAAIQNEVAVLSQLDLPAAPVIIDYELGEVPFAVTLELPGERLSVIVGENSNLESMSYLSEYGETLAKIHQHTYLPARFSGFHTKNTNVRRDSFNINYNYIPALCNRFSIHK